MKIKTIAKAMACATALSVAVCSSAFANPVIDTATRNGSNINVTYSGVTGQMTMLAFDITEAVGALTGDATPDDAANTTYVDQEIVYVTQETAGTSKPFTMRDGYAPAEGETKYLLIKLGGTDIESPAAKVMTLEYAEQTGTQFKYGDVTGDGELDVNDIIAILNYIAESKTITWGHDSIEYAAANVNGDSDVDVNDIIEILNVIAEKPDFNFTADEDGDGYGIFNGTVTASVETAAVEDDVNTDEDAKTDEVVGTPVDNETPSEEVTEPVEETTEPTENSADEEASDEEGTSSDEEETEADGETVEPAEDVESETESVVEAE